MFYYKTCLISSAFNVSTFDILPNFSCHRDDGWIGAQYNSDKSKFVWSDETDLDFAKWQSGEPNNVQVNE